MTINTTDTSSNTSSDTPADLDDDLNDVEITFAELGIATELVDALSDKGITSPFPVQALTIPDALEGRDVCGKAKTGSGKTLAFGLPMLMKTQKARKGETESLVLVPTRELCLQVSAELRSLGESMDLRVVEIYGGVSIGAQINEISQGADIVVATPGRLIDLVDRREISIANVSMVVLDEADQMADMGFLPQVDHVLRSITVEHQTLLFSATLDGVIERIVKRHLGDPVYHEVESDTITVNTMDHRFIEAHQMDKPKVVAAIAENAERVLVFVHTKRGCDRVASALRDEGVQAQAIHGDLAQIQREKVLAKFMNGTLDILVATNVAARGLHVDGVDVVIHYDPPSDHKTYLHRSGRTARAGEGGLVVTLVRYDEVPAVRALQKEAGVRQPIVKMFSNDERLRDLAAFQPPAEPPPVKRNRRRRR